MSEKQNNKDQDNKFMILKYIVVKTFILHKFHFVRTVPLVKGSHKDTRMVTHGSSPNPQSE